MKRFFLGLLISLFLLTACGGNGDAKQPVQPESQKVFETNEIVVEFPDGWEIVTQKDFTREIPIGTIVGFRNPIKNEVFISNLSVTKNDLPQETTASDYGKGLVNRHASTFLEFKEIERGETEASFFTHFEGKERADSEKKEFFQTIIVKEKTAFIATAAFLPDEKEDIRSALEAATKSLRVK